MTPIDDADFDGFASFPSDAGLPIDDLTELGRVFYRVEADALIGYGGIEGEGLERQLVLLPDRRRVGLGGVVLALIEDDEECAGVERLHLLTTAAASSGHGAMPTRPVPRHRPQSPHRPSSPGFALPMPPISSIP